MGRIQSAPERSLKARLGFFLAELLVSFFAHRNPRVADKSITAAVGSPDDLRSAVWRLWVQGDEVYFGATMMLPSLKVSYRGKTDVSCTAWVARACLGGIGDDPFDTLETCERTASTPARERGQGAPFSSDRRSTGVWSTSSARTTHPSATSSVPCSVAKVHPRDSQVARARSVACRNEVGPDRFRQRGSLTSAMSAVRIQG